MKIKEARNNYGHKGPFWYFTTHGVQPGSIPKGVHVLEIRDGRNDKGTMGTFVALDGVLTYDELREYDMKEMSPKINEGFEVTPQLVKELVDEYRSEAYGFNGVKDYVETQYPRHPEEFKKELIKKIKKAMNESLKEDANEKLVIYTQMGEYCVTPKSNYGGRFQNSRKVHHMKDFESAREVMDYWNKYFHTTDDDFEVIDEGCKKTKIKESCKKKGKLMENKWKYELKNGKALRDAIKDGDLEGVCAMLQTCYQELRDKGFIDDYDCDEYVEEIDCLDLDDDYTEDEVDYALDNFYDLCDNIGVWVSF